MTSHAMRPDDRETLSALFDGELDGEARLFASRRLAHDATWQATCGRWQAIGDAMRRQAPIAAPTGFAEGVASAIATERGDAATGPALADPRRPQGARFRWLGGAALAASVALAAVLSFRTTDTPPADAPRVVAAAPAPGEVPGATAVPTPRIASGDRPAAPAETLEERVTAVTPRATDIRPVRPVAIAVASRSTPAPAVADAALQVGESGNPFNLAGDESLTAQPWPRAAVGTGATTFTARYGAAGDSAGQRPSFYPFEPRPQGEPEPVPTP